MNGNDRKLNVKKVWLDFLDRIWSIYFYILFFYVASRMLSYFFESWQQYFNQKAFNISLIFFTILIFFHPTVLFFFKKALEQLSNIKISLPRHGSIKTALSDAIPVHPYRQGDQVEIKALLSDITPARPYWKGSQVFLTQLLLRVQFFCVRFYEYALWFLKLVRFIVEKARLLLREVCIAEWFFILWFLKLVRFIVEKARLLLREVCIAGWFFLKKKWKSIPWSRFLIVKLVTIIGVMSYISFFQQVNIVDFWILLYALASIFFITDGRIAASIALVLLAVCPFLLLSKEIDTAKVFVTYAFYFLVIFSFVQIKAIYEAESAWEKRGTWRGEVF